MFKICLRDAGIDSDYTINNVSSIFNPKSNSIMFANSVDSETISHLAGIRESLIVLKKDNPSSHAEDILNIKKYNCVIEDRDPKLRYSIILNSILYLCGYYDDYNSDNYICNGKYVYSEKNVDICETAKIGHGVTIGPNTKIGRNTVISDGVKIHGDANIGNNVCVGYNSVIGHHGFGFSESVDGLIRMPHLGGVVIEDNVSIGCLDTVVSGTIEPTFIGRGTKIDDHVHIGHNAIIGKDCIITACAELGRLDMGDKVWIGPNSSIIQGVKIGDGALVGIASVVTKDIPSKTVVAGNPADNIDNLKKIRDFIKTNVLSKV